MKKYKIFLLLLIFASSLNPFFSYSQNLYNGIDLDTVKARKFDMGKMWTFDYPPVDYLTETYNFTPSKEWLDNVRMSALKFADYCSASFISEDGLVMTNHHCGRESVTSVENPGEELHKNGFYAESIDKERKVKDLFVEQLIKITDVTKEINDAIDAGSTPEEKIDNKTKKIKELEQNASQESGLRCQVVTLFNGGLYSLYYYKRFNDVRLVFAPEDQAGFFGGDPDNFTYPRYNLDCTFFRVYDENGKPLKSPNYFKWSAGGATLGEPVFVVGNPASTNRLNTIAQLEYKRDVEYPQELALINKYINILEDFCSQNPEMAKFFNDQIFSLKNSQKVYVGMIKGLSNPYLMARKKDFEKNFMEAVESNPLLKDKYGSVWNEINDIRKELKSINPFLNAFSVSMNSSSYMYLADTLIKASKVNEKLSKSFVSGLFSNDIFGENILRIELAYLIDNIGYENKYVNDFIGTRTLDEAVDYLKKNSALTSEQGAKDFIKKSPEEILASDDPLIKFLLSTADTLKSLKERNAKLLKAEDLANQKLGNAVFEVYGNTIPPDATFTLRISDGVIKPYEYNGTIAPPKTTFYGMYDRYYSFEKKNPWDLAKIWINPPKEFRLETPFNFISTCDISGGNSGSPVINKNAEIVGLAFDGNIESLPGDFIYTSETPTTVSVDSEGLKEAIKNLYKAHRLSEEIRTGKLVK
ncbi:MAG: S46 family peptidase [Ignavibacteriae bacterium]|nr:S46 family peptidase [Ignavibacteriota bacterium]